MKWIASNGTPTEYTKPEGGFKRRRTNAIREINLAKY